MTTLLYILMAALAFFVIGYLLAKTGCGTKNERYLTDLPVDPVTEDDGSCEDAGIAAESQKLLDEEAVAKAEEEAAATRLAEAKAQKEAKEKEAKEKEAKEKTGKKKAAKKTAKKNTPETEEYTGIAPEGLLDAPRGGKKDNLTRIKGIGIKIDKALNGIGIYHFDQIAAWTEKNMAWADRELAFPGRARRDDWVGQAKLLMEGKETEFSQRVDEGKVSSSKS